MKSNVCKPSFDKIFFGQVNITFSFEVISLFRSIFFRRMLWTKIFQIIQTRKLLSLLNNLTYINTLSIHYIPYIFSCLRCCTRWSAVTNYPNMRIHWKPMVSVLSTPNWWQERFNRNTNWLQKFIIFRFLNWDSFTSCKAEQSLQSPELQKKKKKKDEKCLKM